VKMRVEDEVIGGDTQVASSAISQDGPGASSEAVGM
jgi:hypothetical protein